jgi:hypothetical protein
MLTKNATQLSGASGSDDDDSDADEGMGGVDDDGNASEDEDAPEADVLESNKDEDADGADQVRGLASRSCCVQTPGRANCIRVIERVAWNVCRARAGQWHCHE